MKPQRLFIRMVGRRGTTLVEISCVASLIGVLLLLSVKALFAANRMNAVTVDTAVELRLAQAAEQRIRNDLSLANRVQFETPETLTLRLTESKSIRYRHTRPRDIDREVIQTDEAGLTKIVGRDTLRFAVPVQLKFDQLKPNLVRVTLESTESRQIVARIAGENN